MAVLAVTDLTRAGINPALVAANIGGDSFPTVGNVFLLITNGGGSPRTVSVAYGTPVDGQTVPPKQVVVPAGASRLAGPYPAALFRGANDQAAVTYDAVTSLTIGAFRLIAE